MDIAIQILATFGPLILVVMGAIVSVRPPKQDGHGHWYWLAAFLVIGLPISFASFFELRSSDTLQGEIHEDVRQLLKKSPTTNEDWPSLSDTEKSQLISAIRLLPPQSITVACETEKCKKVSDDLCDALHYGGWNVTKLHGGGFGAARVKVVVASVMQPTVEYCYQPNASL